MDDETPNISIRLIGLATPPPEFYERLVDETDRFLITLHRHLRSGHPVSDETLSLLRRLALLISRLRAALGESA